MKAEPAGRLVIDPDAMSQLGLQRMDAVQLSTASALILSKPVSPAEAAMICLEEPVVQASSPVDYRASAPPDLRRKRVLAGNQVIAAPVDHYMATLASSGICTGVASCDISLFCLVCTLVFFLA